MVAGAAMVLYKSFGRRPQGISPSPDPLSVAHRSQPLTMKTFVAVCLLACAAAFPQDLASIEGSGEPPVEIAARSSAIDSIFSDEILRSEFEMGDEGQFQYGFETSNGIVVDAAGESRQIGDGVGAVMRGSYSYESPEGIDVTINWFADETGFHATGDQVPAVPEYVTRLLKTLPAAPQPAAVVRAAEEAAPAVEEAAPVADDVVSTEEEAVPAADVAAAVEEADLAAISVPVVSAPAVVVSDPAESVIPDESAFIVLDADSETVEQEELLS